MAQLHDGPPGTLPGQIRGKMESCPFQFNNLALVSLGSVGDERPKVRTIIRVLVECTSKDDPRVRIRKF